MDIIALLPMKGNSERVPNKNLKSFGGAPLYHAIMKTLLATKGISQVVVNTDSDVIKSDINKNFPSVTIIDRPKEICGDYVSMNKVIAHDLEQLEGEHFLQTHSTNPLLSSKTIEAAICSYKNGLNNKSADSVFSVTKLQTRLYNEDGTPLNHNPNELIRTQDLAPLFEENSNFYIFSKTLFSETNQRIGNRPQMVEVPKIEAVDIDTPEDFILAETLYTKSKLN